MLTTAHNVVRDGVTPQHADVREWCLFRARTFDISRTCFQSETYAMRAYEMGDTG